MARLPLVIAALAVAAVLATPPSTSVTGATLTVCPSGCTYTLPSAASAAAKPGDTIQIGAGTYTDCLNTAVDGLTIVGVLDANGKRPTITGKVCGTKGIIVNYKKDTTIKNLELSYGSCIDGANNNCAGIRQDATATNLVIDNMWIHHCDDGILASSSNDNITVTNSLIEINGYGGQAHNMYWGHHASVVFRNSISRHAQGGGHELKCRAYRLEIDQSIIATLGSSTDSALPDDSRLVDYANGGVLIITNSILEKSGYSEATNMVGWNGEVPQNTMPAGVLTSVTLKNNIVINDRSAGAMLLNWYNGDCKPYCYLPTGGITIDSNTYIGLTTSPNTISTQGAITNAIIFASRTAAGYQSYPWLPTMPLGGAPGGTDAAALAGSANAGSGGGSSSGGGSTTPTAPWVPPAYPNAKTLTVCPSGCTYTLPSLANAKAAAGDTIQIGAGTYTDCLNTAVDGLTIVGVLDANGKRPTITGKVCGTKGIIVSYNKGLTVKNLELSYGSCIDGASNNCAGIRQDAAAQDLTIDNMWIHHCDNGILASSKNDYITVTNSLIEHSGYGGQAHNMYWGHHMSVVFRNSISRHAQGGGHEFKCRSYRLEIDQSIIATLGDSSDVPQDSRLVDYANGGILIVTNSILEKSGYSDQPNMLGWTGETPQNVMPSGMQTSVTVTNNIIINDRSAGAMLLNWYNGAANLPTGGITIDNNTYIGLTTSPNTISTQGAITNAIIFASRTAAGYQSFPWLPALPKLQSRPIGPSSTGPAAGSAATSRASSSTGPSASMRRASSTGPAASARGASSTGHAASARGASSTGPAAVRTASSSGPAASVRRPSSSTGSRSGSPIATSTGTNSGTNGGGSPVERRGSAAVVTLAFNLDLAQATAEWQSSVAVGTCSAIKIVQERCTATKVEPGSTILTMRLTGPLVEDTIGASISLDGAVAALKALVAEPTSSLRKSSAFTNFDSTRTMTESTLAQCSDGSYADPCPEYAIGDDNPANGANNSGSSGSNKGLIAGVVVGVVLGLGLITILVLVCMRQRAKRQQTALDRIRTEMRQDVPQHIVSMPMTSSNYLATAPTSEATLQVPQRSAPTMPPPRPTRPTPA